MRVFLNPSRLALFTGVFLSMTPRIVSFTLNPHDARSNIKSNWALSATIGTADELPEGYHPNRAAEFSDLEPLVETTTRQARIQRESKNQKKFAKYGDDLWDLRKTMATMSRTLVDAINNGDEALEYEIRNELRTMECQDPELVYKIELEKLREAKAQGNVEDAATHSKRAMAARSCLPQYNVEGLWVGKYGSHGYELVNCTMVGDTLVAYKVTGDKNVPRGEISFQVDLNPLPPRVVGARSGRRKGPLAKDLPLQPISLTEKAAKKWGTTQLPRYKGLGQVAEPGFTNNQWMDGQLIIIGEEYFSFAWVPIEQQIFFGRPSPELALKMLRESTAAPAVGAKRWIAPPALHEDLQVLKEYATSVLEKTHEIEEEELNNDPFSCIWHGADTEECYFQ